jgi:hypothetical protein
MLLIDLGAANSSSLKAFSLIRAKNKKAQLDALGKVVSLEHLYRIDFIETFTKLLIKYREFGEVIIANCEGKESWRKRVSANYRSKEKPFTQEEEMAEMISNEIVSTFKSATKIKLINLKGIENRDVIASLSRTEGNHLIYAVGNIYKQLVDDNVGYYNISDAKIVRDQQKETFHSLFMKFLMGDVRHSVKSIMANSEPSPAFVKHMKKKHKIEVSKENFFHLVSTAPHYIEQYALETEKNPYRLIGMNSGKAKKIVVDHGEIKALLNNPLAFRNYKVNKQLYDLRALPEIVETAIFQEYMKLEIPNYKELAAYFEEKRVPAVSNDMSTLHSFLM